MQYFQLDLSKDIDIDMVVRFVLKTSPITTPFLNCLCLSNSNANEDIDQLQKMIKSEKLLFYFNIKYIRPCISVVFLSLQLIDYQYLENTAISQFLSNNMQLQWKWWKNTIF